jgi:hypothetical protein
MPEQTPDPSPEPVVEPDDAFDDEDEAPPQKHNAAKVTGRTANGVNWAGVFLLYSKGTSPRELSDQFGIPLGKLMNKMRSEEWDRLVKHHGSPAIVAPPALPSVVKQSAAEVDKAKLRIDANREEAFGIAKRLRGNVENVLRSYEAEGAFLRPEDILTLAKAAKMIDDSAMLALGDVQMTAAAAVASKGAGGQNGLPQIVINIPQFVSPEALRFAEKTVQEIPRPDEEVIQLQELEVVGGKSTLAEATGGKRFKIDFAKLGAAVTEEGED